MKIKIYRNEGLAIGAALQDESVGYVEVDASNVIGPAVQPESFSQEIVVNADTDVYVIANTTVVAPVEEPVVDAPASDVAPEAPVEAPLDVPQKPADTDAPVEETPAPTL